MKKALIYGRVSTLKQRKDKTIDRQLDVCRAYCQQIGYNVFDVYADDGKSGSDKDRAFALIDFVTDHQKDIDVIVFESVDRFSRDVFLTGYLEMSLTRLGVEIISITQEGLFNDDDPYAKMVHTIMKAIAQFDKDMTVYKLTRGKKARIATGKRCSGSCPYGYNYTQEEIGGTRKKVVVIPHESEAVKLAFRTFIDTGSTTKVARALNDAGYVTRRGGKFSRQGVQTILQNDFYTGILTYDGKKSQGQHEPIISKHLFTKAQNRFQA